MCFICCYTQCGLINKIKIIYMWKKKLKFGYIKGKYVTNDSFRNEVDYIFEVFIVKETNDTFEIKYGDNMVKRSSSSHTINGLRYVVSKCEIYGIHEKELNWFQRIYIYDKFS